MKSFSNCIFKKVSKYLLFLLLFIFPQLINSQWISNYYGNSYGDTPLNNAHGTSICVDNYGNCYITGYVDEGSGNNVLVIKYNSQTGDTIWTSSYNGEANEDDVGNAIITNDAGDIYITGYETINGKGRDLLLLKYSPDGTLLFHTTISGYEIDAEDAGVNLSLDIDGNIYVTGFCTDSSMVTGILTVRFDTGGSSNWYNIEAGTGFNAKGTNIAVNNSGTTIYIIGYVTSTTSNNDMVFIKYSLNGSKLFTEYFDGGENASDRAFGIAVDETDYIYITGYSTTDNTETEDFTLLKYNSSGEEMWHRTFNGEGNQSDRAFGIAVDEQDGFIFITGQSTNLAGNNDYLTVAYNPDGDYLWHKNFNGAANDDDEASAIGIVNNPGNTKSIVVTGSSWGLNNNYDYVTIWYDITTGDFQTQTTYSMSSNTEDIAMDLAISNSSDAFITGFSQLLGDASSSSCVVSTQKLGRFEGSRITTLNNTPSKLALYQNYPNPFNPSTVIKFTIQKQSNVKLTVYDVLGREVTILINDNLKPGTYSVTYTTQSLSSGIYFYEIKAGTLRDVKKMTFIK